MNADRAAVRELYATMFDAWNDDDGSEDFRRRRYDFAFHMTDWLGDLAKLHQIATDPAKIDTGAEAVPLYGLLTHIVPHLRAAFRAWEGHECPDPFLEAEQQPLTPVGATA